MSGQNMSGQNRVGFDRRRSSNNFMRQFRDKNTRELKNLTSNQFMEVWKHYDKDGEWL